jgi:hypothetical protein
MPDNYSLDDLRKKAHMINCELSEQNYGPREIEIIGYYLKRIAASYLSYLTHRDLEDTAKNGVETTSEIQEENYNYQS